MKSCENRSGRIRIWHRGENRLYEYYNNRSGYPPIDDNLTSKKAEERVVLWVHLIQSRS